jgi:1,4-alpha-glucan branching enzyme
MWAHPGKKLLFMGVEFAQESEWSENRGLDWWLLDHADHQGVHACVRDVNSVYRETAALWERDLTPDGFEWIDANDASGNTLSFIRRADDGSALVCVANFAALPHEGFRLGLPWAGRWEEVLNTDAEVYVGSGVGNLGSVEATSDQPWHGQPASAVLRLPPLATVWLRAPNPG